MNFSTSVNSFGISWIPPAIIVSQLLMFVWLAIAVMRDADGRLYGNQFLFLKNSLLWFFIVLLGGGYFPALAYWFIHYSSFRFRGDEKA
jgi:hypothetical protein